jgi:hypothetical protein
MARQEMGWGGGMDWMGQGYVAGCCECDNEPQGIIKCD